MNPLPLRSGIRSALITSIQHCTRSLNNLCNKTRKKTSRLKKKINCLYSQITGSFCRKPNGTHKRSTRTNNEFNKVVGYKINIKISTVFLYTRKQGNLLLFIKTHPVLAYIHIHSDIFVCIQLAVIISLMTWIQTSLA